MGERKRLVRELREAKKSFPAIAAELGLTEGQVKHAVQLAGLSNKASDYETRILYLQSNLKEKTCLCCSRRFLAEHSSAGRQIHFLCFECKLSDYDREMRRNHQT